MRAFATRQGQDVLLLALVIIGVGTALLQSLIVFWGAALLLGLVTARAFTVLQVDRVRSRGLELRWLTTSRVREGTCLRELELMAELHNRGSAPVQFRAISALADPALRVRLEPRAGVVGGGARALVKLVIVPQRAGRAGLHGLQMELLGGAGLFQVPLVFCNPLGIQALPAGTNLHRRDRRPRLRRGSQQRRVRERLGESRELRELRELAPGEPLQRIAWKPSARRGRLLVREDEPLDEQTFWILLDGSPELASGVPGKALLDQILEHAASLIRADIARGRRVGLMVVGPGRSRTVPPSRGAGQLERALAELARVPEWALTSRSGWSVTQVALCVHEHLSLLGAERAPAEGPTHLGTLAHAASKAIGLAPFPHLEVDAPSEQERVLRRYLAAFGINPMLTPAGGPRGDGARTVAEFAQCLRRMSRQRGAAAAAVTIISPLPEVALVEGVAAPLNALRRRGVSLHWDWVSETGAGRGADGFEQAMLTVTQLRTRLLHLHLRRRLASLGVKLARVQPPKLERPAAPPPGRTKTSRHPSE